MNKIVSKIFSAIRTITRKENLDALYLKYDCLISFNKNLLFNKYFPLTVDYSSLKRIVECRQKIIHSNDLCKLIKSIYILQRNYTEYRKWISKLIFKEVP